MSSSNEKNYKSSIHLSVANTQENKKRINKHICTHATVRCGILRRKIYLTKFVEATEKRSGASRRFKVYFVALDIIKHGKNFTRREMKSKNCYEYELTGNTYQGQIVKIHLKEETDNYNNKRIYLISCFYI